MSNGYEKYFGYRYYKLVITDNSYCIIDLASIEKPIKDFISPDGFVNIERFDEYLINTLPNHTVDKVEFFCENDDIETICGIKNPYVLYFKRRFYIIASEFGENLVFDLLDVNEPIEIFYFDSVDKVDIEKFNNYLIDYVPCEIKEDIVGGLNKYISDEDSLEIIRLTRKEVSVLRKFLLKNLEYDDTEWIAIYDLLETLEEGC